MIDYATLLALRYLLEQRHISRAAQLASVTQPAMSRTLMRLQKIFADPLLVRTAHGFDLTPRAQALYPQLIETLSQMQALIRPLHFEPRTAQRQFTIAALDYEMIVAIIPLMQQLTLTAPGIQLNIQQQWGKNFSHLAHGHIDFLISAEEESAAGFYRQILYQDEFVCVLNATHPLAKKNKLSLTDYLTLQHCVVSITGIGKTSVDEMLEKQGKIRQIALFIPSFTVALDVCLHTSLACILPRRLLAHHHQKNIKLFKLPFTMPTLTVYLYWHARLHHDPESVWLRKQLKDLKCSVIPKDRSKVFQA